MSKPRMTDEQAEYHILAGEAIKAGKATVNELADAEGTPQQISLRELVERLGDKTAVELLTPERKEQIKVAHDTIRKGIEDLINNPTWIELREQVKAFDKRIEGLQPFYQDVLNAYDDDSELWEHPLFILTGAIDMFIYDRNLEEVKDREEYRQPFLDFFKIFLENWHGLSQDFLSSEDELMKMWNRLKDLGIFTRPIGEDVFETLKTAGEYSKILETPALAGLATVNAKRGQIIIDEFTRQVKATGKGIEIVNEQAPESSKPEAEIIAAFENTLKKVNNLTALKVLDLYRIDQANNSPYGKPKARFILNVKDYMDYCGIPNTEPSYKKAKRDLLEVARAWFDVSINTETKDEKRGIRLLQEQAESKGGNVEFWFTERLAAYLAKGIVSHYHLSLLKVDGRNPNAYFMGIKLQQHYNILNNQERGTADIISVKALLDELQTKGNLPTYEEVKAGARQYKDRIIKPFQDALNNLAFLDKWEYCNAKKKPLTRTQKARFTYQTFIDCYITFQLKDAPDLTEALQNRAAKAAEKAEKKASRNAQKDERILLGEQKDTVG